MRDADLRPQRSDQRQPGKTRRSGLSGCMHRSAPVCNQRSDTIPVWPRSVKRTGAASSAAAWLPILLLCAIAGSAAGHEIRPAIADLLPQPDGGYRLEIRVNLEALLAGIGPQHRDTDQSDKAGAYARLRRLEPAALQDAFAAFEARFLEGLVVHDSEQRRLAHTLVELRVPDVGDPELARDSTVVLRAAAPAGGGPVVWSWDAVFGASILRVTRPGEDNGYSAYLRDGQASDPIPLDAPPLQSRWSVFANYLSIGFTHIVPLGLDHILFVIGLFLLSPRARPLLWQITGFTLAHSVTLALGVLGLVQVSPAIVEPIIAASIVYVCVENMVSPRLQRWRPLVVFGFGLLHGLGFAGVLAEVGIASGAFITALLAFNLGVELGQLAVIAGCFALIGYWFGDRPWYRRALTTPASGLIALIGAWWFIERTLL